MNVLISQALRIFCLYSTQNAIGKLGMDYFYANVTQPIPGMIQSFEHTFDLGWCRQTLQTDSIDKSIFRHNSPSFTIVKDCYSLFINFKIVKLYCTLTFADLDIFYLDTSKYKLLNVLIRGMF